MLSLKNRSFKVKQWKHVVTLVGSGRWHLVFMVRETTIIHLQNRLWLHRKFSLIIPTKNSKSKEKQNFNQPR